MTADVTTRYLGLELSSPVVASASPLTGRLDTVAAIVDAGAAAVVLPSLFEEEILQEEVELNRALEAGSEHFAEALDYFPDVVDIAHAGDRYVTRLAETRAAVQVPVIASLNATTPGGWVRYATELSDAGADAIELNLYNVAADSTQSGSDVEAAQLELVEAIRAAVDVPLAVKLSPYFSSLAHFAHQLVVAGADGLVLFNRFYQPDIDLDEMEVVPRLDLSSRWELRLPLRWTAILSPRLVDTSIAVTSGVETGIDVAKAVAVGADVAMTTSSLLRYGPKHVRTVIDGLAAWLDEHEYESVDQLRGSMSHTHTADPSAFERAQYFAVLHSWSTPPELTPSSPSS